MNSYSRWTLALGLAVWVAMGLVYAPHCAGQDFSRGRIQEAVALRESEMLAELTLEVSKLKDAVAALQQQLDQLAAKVTTALDSASGPALPGEDFRAAGLIPVPGGDRGVYRVSPGLPDVPDEPEPFSYTVVDQWGRDPEAAAALGGGVASLKGLVVAVPKGSTDEDLIEMAGALRKQFDAYDNINIEAFEGLDAARRFVERGVADAGTRLLSISKHRKSARDTVLLIRGNAVRDVTELATGGGS